MKKPSNAFFGKTVGNFGNLTTPSPPISGPCASFWNYSPKLYLDSKWVKIAIFVKSRLFFFIPEIYTTLKRHEKLNYEKNFFFPSLSPSQMINLHWSFRWGYGEVFLSNCCFKKRCVDSNLPPSGANRVKNRLTPSENF